MTAINADTPVEQVAALVSQALEAVGITATISGGAGSHGTAPTSTEAETWTL